MAWITTVKGELLNLSRISSVRVEAKYGKYVLVAYEPMGRSETLAPYDDLIAPTEDKEEAEAALAAIGKLVGAQTVSELREIDRSRTGFRRG